MLLVEDDPNDVLFMRRAWKQAGHPAPLIVVEDGEKAVAYLSGAEPYSDRAQYPFPSHVLLDLKMPFLSGLEVLEWIRSTPEVKTLPVTILSSSAEPGDVERARQLGISDYIVKPSTLQELLNVVKRFSE